MIVFGNLIYHCLVYVDLNSFPFFGGNEIFSIVLCVHILHFLHTFKKNSKKFYFCLFSAKFGGWLLNMMKKILPQCHFLFIQ